MLSAMIVTYVASRIGQKKAGNEMQKLRQFAEESIKNFEQ